MKITSALTKATLFIALSSAAYAQSAYYGIVGSNQIWGVDLTTRATSLLTTTGFNEVNGLAYDPSVDRLIYQEDFGIPGIGQARRMAYYDFATNTRTLLNPAGTSTFQASNGTFHNGQYWYIESSTDNLYRTTINYSNNTYSSPIFVDSVVNNAFPMDFGDIVFDSFGNLLISGGHTVSTNPSNQPLLRLYNPITQLDSIRGPYVGQIARNNLTNIYYGAEDSSFFIVNPANAARSSFSSLGFGVRATDLAIRPIPEPSTTALAALVGSLCLLRRRRA